MKKQYTYDYPMPAVTTDCILVTTGNDPKILLIRRKHDPYAGKWALPGGFVEIDEDLPEAALRELQEETGLRDIDLKQFRTYGRPGRDPRGRTISVVYYGFVAKGQKTKAGDDAAEAAWFSIDKLPPLAFDHDEIITDFRDSMKI